MSVQSVERSFGRGTVTSLLPFPSKSLIKTKKEEKTFVNIGEKKVHKLYILLLLLLLPHLNHHLPPPSTILCKLDLSKPFITCFFILSL